MMRPPAFSRYFSLFILTVCLLLLSNCRKESPAAITQKQSSADTVISQASLDTVKMPLRNMFGVNAYAWNFLQNPADPSNVAAIYEPKMADIRNFTAYKELPGLVPDTGYSWELYL